MIASVSGTLRKAVSRSQTYIRQASDDGTVKGRRRDELVTSDLEDDISSDDEFAAKLPMLKTGGIREITYASGVDGRGLFLSHQQSFPYGWRWTLGVSCTIIFPAIIGGACFFFTLESTKRKVTSLEHAAKHGASSFEREFEHDINRSTFGRAAEHFARAFEHAAGKDISSFERTAKDNVGSAELLVVSLLHLNTTTYTTSTTTSTTSSTSTSTTHTSTSSTTTTLIPRAKVNTSLHCIFVIQPPPSYEVELARYLFRKGLSIFSCPSWRVYSDRWDEPIDIGNTTSGEGNTTVTEVIESIPIPGPSAYGGMMWGRIPMLFNANVFYRAWEEVIKEGAYLDYAFTLKVDADAVFLPRRLAKQLEWDGHLDEPDKGEGKFFLNCPKFNSMQGPLEVFSRAAMRNFGRNKHKCYDAHFVDMPEDISMRVCMQLLGTRTLQLFGAVYDTRCERPGMNWWTDCSKPNFAVFHPMKGLKKWKSCYKKVLTTDAAAEG